MKKHINQRGQALITLLFFVIIGITITSAAAIIIYVNSIAGTNFQQGIVAYHVAQGGAENALLRLLRDPSYRTENDLVVGDGLADIAITGGGTSLDPFIIRSTGQIGDFVRTIEITVYYENNILTVQREREVF